MEKMKKIIVNEEEYKQIKSFENNEEIEQEKGEIDELQTR